MTRRTPAPRRPEARLIAACLLAACLLPPAAARAAAGGAACPVPEGPVRARLALPDGTVVLARDGALQVGDRLVTRCDGLPDPFPTALALHDGRVAVGFRAAGLHLWSADGFEPVPGLPADAVRALAAAPGGDLWIGTGASGLWRLAPGARPARFAHRVLGRREISALHATPDGALHVGAGLYGWWRVRADGRVGRIAREVYAGCFRGSPSRPSPRAPGPACDLGAAPAASGLPSGHVTALALHRGRLVVGTFDGGLAEQRPDGTFAPVPGAPPFVNALLSDGPRLWVATPKGLWRRDGAGAVARVRLGLPSEHVNGLALAPDGVLWLATGEGLAGLEPSGRVRLVGEAAGLPSRLVYAVAVAEDGAVWAGTAGGALRLAPDGLQVYTQASGALTHDWVNALLPDGDTVLAGTYDAGVVRLFPDGRGAALDELGGLWVNPGGLARLDDGRLAVATLGDGLVLDPAALGPRAAAGRREALRDALPATDVTAALLVGDALWVGTRGGLVRLDGR